jgi:serine/threonine protein kinase
MNATAEDSTAHDSALEAGQVLDSKYRVDCVIGQGGMATVWAGTNERTGKRVALKVLLRSVSDTPGAKSLFQGEVLAASRVNHPNVVTVFDIIDHQGTACIVMELLEGETFDQHLGRTGRMSVAETAAFLLPAMRGVVAAHAQGVIHRDLKPQNIFICLGPDGRPVTTKVLDFGISLIAERSRYQDTMGSKGIAIGTPAYMAPEQLMGKEQVDERVDVYGFGVLFYEALTGQVPFPGEPGKELYRRILLDPPPPLAQIRPDVSPTLVRLIETALAKAPEQRPNRLEEMLAVLESELAKTTETPVGPATSPTRPPTLERRLNLPSVLSVGTEAWADERQQTRMLVNFPLEAELGARGPAFIEDDTPAYRPKRRGHGRTWQTLAGASFAGLFVGMGFVLWQVMNADGETRVDKPSLLVPPPPIPAVVPLSPPEREPPPAAEAQPPRPNSAEPATTEIPEAPLPEWRDGAETRSRRDAFTAAADYRAKLFAKSKTGKRATTRASGALAAKAASQARAEPQRIAAPPLVPPPAAPAASIAPPPFSAREAREGRESSKPDPVKRGSSSGRATRAGNLSTDDF